MNLKAADSTTQTLLKISEITSDLVSTKDLDHLLAKITNAVMEIVSVEAATIFLYDSKNNQLYFKVALGEKGEEVTRFRLPADDSSIAGWVANNRQAVVIQDAAKDPRHYKKIDKEVGYVTRSILGVPVLYRNELLGVIEAINKKEGDFKKEDEDFLLILASQVAIAIANARLFENLMNFFVNGIELLITALENPVPTSRGHTFRVARIATALARELGIKGQGYENIYYAALLHDVGMIKLPTSNEPMNLRLHPVLGAEMIERIKILENIVPLIRYHHERTDGSGYPEGIRGDKIPLEAQIIGLAEAFDEDTESTDDPERFQLFLGENQNKFKPELLAALEKIFELQAAK